MFNRRRHHILQMTTPPSLTITNILHHQSKPRQDDLSYTVSTLHEAVASLSHGDVTPTINLPAPSEAAHSTPRVTGDVKSSASRSADGPAEGEAAAKRAKTYPVSSNSAAQKRQREEDKPTGMSPLLLNPFIFSPSYIPVN